MANINPDYWFLDDNAFRGFRERFTSENLVVPLNDGKAYMDDLAAQLEQAILGQSGTRRAYYFTGWRATPSMSIRPGTSPATYKEVILRLIAAGLDVRGILWNAKSFLDLGPKHNSENIAINRTLKDGADRSPIRGHPRPLGFPP